MNRLLVATLLCGWILLTAGGVIGAELEAGALLVARENIRDPRFHETVVLVLQHDQQGTVGLILNRPSRLTLAEVMPDRPELAIAGTLSYGGPVAPEATMALVAAGENRPIPAQNVVGSLYVTGIEPLAGWLTAGGSAALCRVFLGYAGWAPGQLEKEILGDAWQLLPADERQPFSGQLDGLWQKLRKLDQQPASS